MEKVDIKIAKCKATEFFVKTLDFDECMELHEKSGQGDEHSRLVQLCLVDGDGERVFKPQQIKLIKDRISGIDMSCVLMVANAVNDFDKVAEYASKYQKN